MTDKEIAGDLDGWFDRMVLKSSYMRRINPVWKVMRDRLTLLGNWKNRPRGAPRRGYLVSRKNMNNE